MPWSISKRDGQYCVIKDTDGSVEGCHASRGEAADQIRALYASEADDAAMMEDDSMEDHMEDMVEIADQLRMLAERLVGDHNMEEPAEVEEPEAGPDIETPDPAMDAVHWEGPVTYEGIATGDGRTFGEGAVVWDEALLPFPFKWQRVSAGGHDASITIGRVDTLSRKEDGVIWGTGIILGGPKAPPEAIEYSNLLDVGAAGGVSIDGDNAEFEVEYIEDADGMVQEVKMFFSRINIRALTAVDIPAFAGAKIKKCSTMTAAVIGATDLPVTDRERNWDGLAAQRAIFDWAKTEGENKYDHSKLARAFLWRDSDGDPDAKGSYKLPFTEVIDGTLTIVPKAVFAAAAAVQGARGGVNIPDGDKAGIRRKLGSLYNRIPPIEGEDQHPTPPWERSSDENDANSVEIAEFSREMGPERDLDTVLASFVPINPPSEWFEAPNFDSLQPVTITDEGRVFGHLCGKETCHIGYGTCKTSPRNCDYDDYFHLGALKTAEGDIVNVGHMTFGAGHAPLEMSAQAAAALYDSTSHVSADIRCGEDEFGTWVVGALRPGLSEEDLREIRSAPLSGDWRPVKNKLQLIAAHAVNVPGFPIPRARVLVASGETQTVIITEDCGCEIAAEFDRILFELDIEEID